MLRESRCNIPGHSVALRNIFTPICRARVGFVVRVIELVVNDIICITEQSRSYVGRVFESRQFCFLLCVSEVVDLGAGQVADLNNYLVHPSCGFLYILFVREELTNCLPELTAVLGGAEFKCGRCDPKILAEDFVLH